MHCIQYTHIYYIRTHTSVDNKKRERERERENLHNVGHIYQRYPSAVDIGDRFVDTNSIMKCVQDLDGFVVMLFAH